MGANESREELSEDIIYEKVNNIHKFLSENNIDNILTSEQKDEFSQMFNDLLDYLSLYILDDETTNEILKSIDNEFDDDIVSETFYFINNMKDFIRKKESIENSINEKEELSELFKKFKYVHQQKDQIFEPDNELKNNLDFILQYIKRKNDDMNGLNETMKDFNTSLTNASFVLKNMVRRQEIEKELSDLNKSLDTKDLILNLSNEITHITTKRSNLLNELEELTKQSLNHCTSEQQELIKKYSSGEITQEEFNKKVYQKPLDEKDDLRYKDELTRIIEIYNNSSKTESDKKEIVTKMDDFIKSIQIDEPLLTVFNN